MANPLDLAQSLPADLQATAWFGPYRVLGRLGRTGELLLARRTGGEVVVLRAAPAMTAVIERVEALARVEHPGLARIEEVGVENGLVFAAERFAAGGSLADLLNEMRDLPLEEARAQGRDRLPGSGSFEARAAALGARVAEALAALHSASLAHGRVRPTAILFEREGRVVLGGAELAPVERLPAPTPYSAPERLHPSSTPTPLADLFALGAVLYELFTFCPPFLGASPAELAQALGNREPYSPRRLQPHLAPGAETLLLAALAKAPHKRFASAAALSRDLDALARGAPLSVSPPSRWQRAFGLLWR
jgi:serine/threonine-protein kinase